MSSIAAAVATMCISSASSAAAMTTMPGRHDKIGDVESAGMGGAVGADQPGPVDGEADRQLLDGDVMHDLVVGALEEGRIDGGEGLEALGGKPGGEGHRVLLGDADIERALGKDFGEAVEPRAGRHGRGDGDDLGVGARLLDQALGEHLGVARRRAGGLAPLARRSRH